MGPTSDPGDDLLALYDQALPAVYGYLRPRCGGADLAQELTAATFLAACAAVRRPEPPVVSLPWLVGVARHKLVDHWREEGRRARRQEQLTAGAGPCADDPWDRTLDAVLAHQILGGLGPHHRAALTLRYVDDLPVAEVARLLDRTPTATEALLVRARSAFRREYEEVAGRA